MRFVRGLATVLSAGAGTAMLTAGPVLVVRGGRARAAIRAELRSQMIAVPGKESAAEPAGDKGRDEGRVVETGPEARAYAEVIGRNVLRATGGRTYSQVSAELLAAEGGDDKLAEARRTAFMGQMLRASLLNAHQAWELTSLVIGLGVLLTGTGAALVATGAALASDR
ncbi:hypothetical protein [Microbispora sp. NPDC046933]|uniref:hypothetical protein n=1 Tax=Microbispora sp. NPDC046933 TaxID=3155618 RepID=UPI003411C437